MTIQACGSIKNCAILATIAVLSTSAAARAVTPGEVSAACGPCHGLTVNSVVVSAGPGTNRFTSYVMGRDQGTWVNTIGRMQGYGAAVADVNGTAAYLAGLGAQPAGPTDTPTDTPTVTPTGTPSRDATATPIGRRPPPHRTRRPKRTPRPTFTARPTPTATPNPVSGNGSGAAAYGTYCARCHEPASPTFVGETVHGTSAGEIAGAIVEVPQMQFLQTLPRGTLTAIAAYLGSVNPGGGGGGGDGGEGGGGDN